MKKKNNTFTILSLIGVVFIAVALIVFPAKNINTKLTGADFLKKYKTTENAVLIDVRTPEEFNADHIAGAINIDYDNQTLFETEIKKLDTSKTYFIYCRSGNRSGKAFVLMQSIGIKNLYDLQGGIKGSPELLQ